MRDKKHYNAHFWLHMYEPFSCNAEVSTTPDTVTQRNFLRLQKHTFTVTLSVT